MITSEKYIVGISQIHFHYKYGQPGDDVDDDEAKSESTLPYLSRDIHIIWSILPTVGRVEKQPYSSSISLANYPGQLGNETTTFEIEMC